MKKEFRAIIRPLAAKFFIGAGLCVWLSFTACSGGEGPETPPTTILGSPRLLFNYDDGVIVCHGNYNNVATQVECYAAMPSTISGSGIRAIAGTTYVRVVGFADEILSHTWQDLSVALNGQTYTSSGSVVSDDGTGVVYTVGANLTAPGAAYTASLAVTRLDGTGVPETKQVQTQGPLEQPWPVGGLGGGGVIDGGISLIWMLPVAGPAYDGIKIALVGGGPPPANCDNAQYTIGKVTAYVIPSQTPNALYGISVCTYSLAGGQSVVSSISVQAGPACFLADTRIELADGGTRRIDEIRPGMRVLSYDERGDLTSSVVERIRVRPVHGYLDVVSQDGEVSVTREHPFYVGPDVNRIAGMPGFRRIGEVAVGDDVFTLDGDGLRSSRLLSKTAIDDDVMVFNLHMARGQGPATYFANGFAVHNY